MIRAAAERLQRSFVPAYLAALVFGAAALAAVLRGRPLALAAALALLPLALEAALRALLRLAYGSGWLYRLRPYLLADHPEYGYGLRPGTDLRAAPFPLYEKYAFRPGAGLIPDPARNRAERLAVTVNSRGFRGPEFAPAKKAGVLRVFCSGGSTTAGQCVEDHETWPVALQARLAELGMKAEVINGGVYGWDSYPELQRLKREILSYEPDVVLLHEGWNEEFNFSSLGSAYRPRVARGYLEKYFFYALPSALFPSFLLSAVLLRKELGRERFLKSKMAFTVPERWLTLKRQEYMQDWFDNVVEAGELCAGRGVRLFLVDYPSLVRVDDDPASRKAYVKGTRLTPLHADYQALSKARIDDFFSLVRGSLPVLDGAAPFRGVGGTERLALFSDELHLTPAGEARLGAAVGDALVAALKEPPPRFDPEALRRLRPSVGVNTKELSFAVDRARGELLKKRPEAASAELPTDRYTNY